jgi:nucleoside-diphosphate-sugar epimerase
VIAILGATGYIGLSLARLYAETGSRPLALFSRSAERLGQEPWPADVHISDLGQFSAGDFDLVINAIGAGDPRRVAHAGDRIVELTRHWDAAVLDTMGAHTRYVFLSSGAIYGAEGIGEPGTTLPVPVNAPQPLAPYVAAKLIAELGHRALAERPILDLRVFGYAEPTIALDGDFFLADLARNLVRGGVFVTSPVAMTRDYAGAPELKSLIDCWEAAGAANGPLDLYTLAPVSKQELLDAVRARYGLSINYTAAPFSSSAGLKPYYASNWRRAAALGYAPERTALEIVIDMLDRLVTSSKSGAATPESRARALAK